MDASVNRVAASGGGVRDRRVGAPAAAEAASGTPGSEYDVTFSGSASAHIVSSSHSGGDPSVETNSADQTANWKVLDNSPARLWLPTRVSTGAESLVSTATTQHAPRFIRTRSRARRPTPSRTRTSTQRHHLVRRDGPVHERRQAKITLGASDHSSFSPCPAGINPQDSCTGPDFPLSGTYTLTKVCAGTIFYAGGSVTGQCGASAAPLKLTNAGLGKSRVASHKGFVLKVTLTAPGEVSVKLLRHVTRVSHQHKRHVLVAAGTLTLTGRSGANSFTIGRVGGHRLAPGSYELVVSAGAGKRTLSLTVTR